MQAPAPLRRPFSAFRSMLTSEAGGGLVLMASAVLALVVANSPLAERYFAVLQTKVGGLSVLHWINDALMALFFLLVGLEIKREMLDGRLRTWPDRILPGLAALGGMAAPALVYVAVNRHSPETLRGWAIPAATDTLNDSFCPRIGISTMSSTWRNNSAGTPSTSSPSSSASFSGAR